MEKSAVDTIYGRTVGGVFVFGGFCDEEPWELEIYFDHFLF